MPITAKINRPHPNRMQVLLGDDLVGPLYSVSLGLFNPRRDLSVYSGGIPLVVQSYTFDPVRNRYLLFFEQGLDFDAITQVIHHVPNPPFGELDANPDLYRTSLGHDPDILADPGVSA